MKPADDLDSLSVLIADDERTITVTLRDALEEEGHTVVVEPGALIPDGALVLTDARVGRFHPTKTVGGDLELARMREQMRSLFELDLERESDTDDERDRPWWYQKLKPLFGRRLDT